MDEVYGDIDFYAVYVLNGVRIPARDKDRHNPRKQLHGAVKQALGVMQDGQDCEVIVYQHSPGPFLRLVFSVETFVRVNGRARNGTSVYGEEDWLIPLLTPEGL